MAADPGIYNSLLQPPRSAVDYANDYARADALRNQNALQALNLQQETAKVGQGLAATNALSRIASGWNSDTTLDQRIADLRNSGLAPLMTQADTLQTQADNRTKVNADAAKASADAGKTVQDTQIAAHNQHLQALATVNSPSDALAWLSAGVQNKTITPQQFQQGVTNLQSAAADPTGQAFAQWKQANMRGGMTIQQQMEQTAPKPTEVRLGNVVKTIDTNPYSSSFGKEVVSQQAIGVSPDTVATQAGENARAAAQREMQLTIAGMSKDGQLSPQLEAEAQMIAAGRAAPPSGMAATRPAAAALMARVSQINPDYDATTYGAKVKAAKDFATGPQGNQMRSFQVANDHLDQLLVLANAVNNGDIPTINRIGNAFGVATGQAPVAVFNAVRGLVGPEITAAITSGGGSAHEREEASNTFNANSSPAQFAGTIGATRDLMRSKYNAMVQQRRAAGLPDATLPQYGGNHGGAPALPSADAIAAELQRRAQGAK